MDEAMVKRLDLARGDKWDSMLQGISDVASLPDPTGKVTYATTLDDGLDLYRVTCPIGVLLVIFEARPEVVVNIATLAIKSGAQSPLLTRVITESSLQEMLRSWKAGRNRTARPSCFPRPSQLVLRRQRCPRRMSRQSKPAQRCRRCSNSTGTSTLWSLEGAGHLCRISRTTRRSRWWGMRMEFAQCIWMRAQTRRRRWGWLWMPRCVPCSLWMPSLDDLCWWTEQTNYPSACNAAETLIVHEKLLSTVWPKVASALLAANVQLLCDAPSLAAIPSSPLVSPSTDADYSTEHLSLKIAVKTLPSLSAAIQWINAHGSHHTDAIVTENDESASIFVRGVDSSGTYVNASTRFADGFRYGFGTEVGIATGRIHARGPVGLEGLVTYKYMMKSEGPKGHVVGEFGSGGKTYKHTPIQASAVPF